ncbi:MAG: TIGR02281 family clan AA aspartic protease [Betaproteobacteria bacterium]|nr:MAG: TIGR02281 family clan AA aspartic protease [Betaproteobacteria bacterium]
MRLGWLSGAPFLHCLGSASSASGNAIPKIRGSILGASDRSPGRTNGYEQRIVCPMCRNHASASDQSSVVRPRGDARILLVLAVIALGSGAANADTLYRCTDALGSVLYTNESANKSGCAPLGTYSDRPRMVQQPERNVPNIRSECIGGNCSIKIDKSKDGHFYVDGAVNGTKVRFLVDTGSSGVVLSQSTASEASVYGSKSVLMRTAGGTVSGSIALNVPISIANRPPINSDVAINPSLDEATSLLGQSYLKMFKVTIQGATMELSP